MRLFRILFFSILCGLISLGGQSVSSEEVPPIQANLTGVSLNQNVRDLYLWTGKEYTQVNFYPGVRTRRVAYAGSRSVGLYKKLNKGEGEVEWTMVAQAELKGNASDYLIFVSKDPASSTVGMFALPEDLAQFKIGSYRFINLTNKRLAIKLGDVQSVLKPMGVKDVSGEMEHGTSYRSLIVELPENDIGVDPKLLFSSSIYFNENVRMLYLISNNENGSGIRLTGIPQK